MNSNIISSDVTIVNIAINMETEKYVTVAINMETEKYVCHNIFFILLVTLYVDGKVTQSQK